MNQLIIEIIIFKNLIQSSNFDNHLTSFSTTKQSNHIFIKFNSLNLFEIIMFQFQLLFPAIDNLDFETFLDNTSPSIAF